MTTTIQTSPQAHWNHYVYRMASGDETALESLMRESRTLVVGIARRSVRVGDEGEIVSDVFMQVWRSAATFDPARGTAAAWVTRIAHTRAIDHHRKRARRAEDIPLNDADGTERNPAACRPSSDSAHARMLVERVLEQLPNDTRGLIRLAFVEGLSHSEISQRLRLPLGTVKTRIRVGMLRMRCLGDQLGRSGNGQNACRMRDRIEPDRFPTRLSK